jgi:hypothetical protein
MHASSAGLKALCTFSAAQGLEDCRKCCGGHGVKITSTALLSLHRVDKLITHSSISTSEACTCSLTNSLFAQGLASFRNRTHDTGLHYVLQTNPLYACALLSGRKLTDPPSFFLRQKILYCRRGYGTLLQTLSLMCPSEWAQTH